MDFIKGLLKTDVNDRKTYLKALSHHWITSLNYENIGIDPNENDTHTGAPQMFSIHLRNAEKFGSFKNEKLSKNLGNKSKMKAASKFKKLKEKNKDEEKESPFADKEEDDKENYTGPS